MRTSAKIVAAAGAVALSVLIDHVVVSNRQARLIQEGVRATIDLTPEMVIAKCGTPTEDRTNTAIGFRELVYDRAAVGFEALRKPEPNLNLACNEETADSIGCAEAKQQDLLWTQHRLELAMLAQWPLGAPRPKPKGTYDNVAWVFSMKNRHGDPVGSDDYFYLLPCLKP